MNSLGISLFGELIRNIDDEILSLTASLSTISLVKSVDQNTLLLDFADDIFTGINTEIDRKLFAR